MDGEEIQRRQPGAGTREIYHVVCVRSTVSVSSWELGLVEITKKAKPGATQLFKRSFQ